MIRNKVESMICKKQYEIEVSNIIINDEQLRKYIGEGTNFEDLQQLYFKLVDDKLFLVYVERDCDYWNYEPWEFLPFAFKVENQLWKSDVCISITKEQEPVAFNNHENWPKSFPNLCEMTKFFDKS